MRKAFLYALIGAFSLAALIAISIFLFDLQFGNVEYRILGTTLLVGGFSLSSFCQTLFAENRSRRVAFISLCITFVTFLISVIMVWSNHDFGDPFLRLFFILLTLTIFFTHMSLFLLLKPTASAVKGTMFVTVVCAALTTLMLDFDILTGFAHTSDLYIRLNVVMGILSALGTVVSPIANLITRRS